MSDFQFQRPWMYEKQFEAMYDPARFVAIEASTKSGKAQPLDAVLWTDSGPIRMGDVRVGQHILTPSGSSPVLKIFPQGVQSVYRITFDDGSSCECTTDHLWQIGSEQFYHTSRRIPRSWFCVLPFSYLMNYSSSELQHFWIPTVLRNGKNTPRRYIRSIEYSRDAECQCIKIETDDGLYLTNDLIVTHNTVSAIIWICEQAYLDDKPGGNYWWIAPIYRQARIAYRRMVRYLPQDCFQRNDSEPTITTINDQTIWFKGSDNPDSLYGEDVRGAVIDESSRCFVAGTLVDTPEGPQSIESLKVGNHVLNALGIGYVLQVHKRQADRLARVTIGGLTLVSTPDHRYCTRRGWVEAQNLVASDTVISRDESLAVTRVDRVEILERGHPDFASYSGGADTVPVYDITVSGHPSFSVSGVLVHNCKGDTWPSVRSTLSATYSQRPDRYGRCRLIGNVKGRRNWFYTLARRAESGARGWGYHRLTALDAVQGGVLSMDEIESAREDLPDAVYRELYFAEPSDDQGNPFGIAAIRACILPDLSDAPVAAWGVDLAKSQDWTVAIGLDRTGRVAAFERWQGPWDVTIARLRGLLGSTTALVDSTGVGDPIVEQLQQTCVGVQGLKFTAATKQQLMEGLAAAIQEQSVGYPDGPIVNELEEFEYEYTRTGVRYAASQGQFDDCVVSLALAKRALSMIRPGMPILSVVASGWNGEPRETLVTPRSQPLVRAVGGRIIPRI